MKCFLADRECTEECRSRFLDGCLLLSSIERFEDKFNTINTHLSDISRTLDRLLSEIERENRKKR